MIGTLWGENTTNVKNVVSNATAGDPIYGYGIDASKGNPIYGNSNTVQPPAIVLIPQIKY